jgi:hypothetical protein
MNRNWIAISTLAVSLALPGGMLAARANAAPAPAAPGLNQDRPWDQPPDEFRDVQRQGFHDGIDAAHHDIDNHRHRDADDHDRFRRPPVDRHDHDMVRDYRDAFRRGYDVAWHHFEEHHGW